MANLLIIGNGFDLYHHLPTRYTDFLFFVNNWELFTNEHQHASLDVSANQKFDISLSDKGELIRQSICDFARYKNAYTSFRLNDFANHHNNHWIHYFNSLLESKSIGNKWIDFETEIYNALKCIEEYFDYYSYENNKYVSAFLSSRAVTLINEFNSGESEDLALDLGRATIADPVILADHKRRYIDHMMKELNKLINCLYIYILEFVCRVKCNYYSEQIRDLMDVYLLNFNYTNTFKNIYGSTSLISTHSIHGEANSNNLVLGIPDDSFNNTEYIYFQKYFQRIQKMTGNNYKYWLQKYSPIATDILFDVNEVYVFGHSLAETDKGILKDVFVTHLDSFNHIHIFYHSQKSYEEMVINLIKMFGKEYLISNTGNGRIIFEKLEEAKLVDE